MDKADYDCSETDLKQAAEFRDSIHAQALAKVRHTYPQITSVVDRCPVDAYLQLHWDYPGKWYTIVAVPTGFGSRDALIDAIVRDTIEQYREDPTALTLPEKPFGPAPQRSQTSDGPDRCPDDPFYETIAAYPACVLDYCIVTGDPIRYRGCLSHRQALIEACQKLFAPDAENEGWGFDISRAHAKRTETEAAFTSVYPKDGLNYRKAFLYPPHENRYTGVDFVKVNAVLFPNGTDCLDIYEWTTDWSDYFDEGHEWWGALCYTMYDKSLDRFVVILASATD